MRILGYRTGGVLIAAALLLMPMSGESMAQQAGGGDPARSYPTKPIRWIVDGGSGGLSDAIARAVGQKLTDVWGRPIVYDARPGASGTIAYELGARAPADGYTLLSVSAPFLINDLVYDKLPYDTRKDFAPIGLTAAYSLVLLTNLKVPAKTVGELIAYAKTKPGGITWATTGAGTSPFFATELFRKQAGFDGVHVPYNSSPASLIDLMGERIDFTMVVMPSAIAHIRARRVHALAVTLPARSTLLPEVPTVAESGLPGFQSVGYTGVVAQAAVPKTVVAKLNAEMVRALKSSDVLERILNLGCEPRSNTPEEFGRLLVEELARWAPVVRETGTKLKR